MFPYLTKDNSVVIFVDGVPHTIEKSHINYSGLVDAIKSDNEDAIRDLLTPKQYIESLSSGRVSIVGDKVLLDNFECDGSIVTRILKLFSDGFDPKPFMRFMENIDSNPSFQSRKRTFDFLSACELPITEDGHFLAYKRVNSNYTDVYTGTIDNSIGKIVEMNRRDVNDDDSETCSNGLHVCSYSYLSSYQGDVVIVCKVNPRDVVSVPTDYNNAKMRVCRYEVVSEIPLEEALKDSLKDYQSDDASEDEKCIHNDFETLTQENKLRVFAAFGYTGYEAESMCLYDLLFEYSFDEVYEEIENAMRNQELWSNSAVEMEFKLSKLGYSSKNIQYINELVKEKLECSWYSRELKGFIGNLPIVTYNKILTRYTELHGNDLWAFLNESWSFDEEQVAEIYYEVLEIVSDEN
jgi:hypothetical protein